MAGTASGWELETFPCVCMAVYVTICYMKRTTIYVTPEQIAGLAKLTAKTGAPAAELIRRAINEYLKSQGVK